MTSGGATLPGGLDEQAFPRPVVERDDVGQRVRVTPYSTRRTAPKPARPSSSCTASHVNGVRTEPYQMTCATSLAPSALASSSRM